MVFRDELQWLAACPNVRVVYVLSDHRRRRGGGHDPLEPAALRGLVPDVAERDVFVCGPAAMTRPVVEGLRRLGVPPAHVRTEAFRP